MSPVHHAPAAVSQPTVGCEFPPGPGPTGERAESSCDEVDMMNHVNAAPDLQTDIDSNPVSFPVDSEETNTSQPTVRLTQT